ncbi:MAG: sugar ABC transporter permease, partial [Oscillospiraceae bacterium]
VPAVATALIWYFLFLPGDAGLVNLILGKIGIPPLSWLQDKNLSIPTIIFTMSWKGFGASALIYLAALQGVSHELYEAATIDGAGIPRKIWSITLPQVSGIILLMFVRQIVGVFQVMMEPMIMTDGGPNNASLSLNLHTYLSAFRYYQIDKALALSVITFLILIVMTVFYFIVKKKVED